MTEKEVFNRRLRQWARDRFGKWITHNSANNAYIDFEDARRRAALSVEQEPVQEAGDDYVIRYALRYGGMCRDCADTRVMGICDNSGMPCDSDVCSKVMNHALKAWRYGVKHGFLADPLFTRPSTEVDRLKAENERLRAFVDSFKFSVVEQSFYKDTYLHLIEPDSVTFKLASGSQFSGFISKLEARRAALSQEGE